MSDALTPLRHVYDVEPAGAPSPGASGHPEHEALRQMRALLDRRPASAPSPRAVAAVEARAALVTAVLDQTTAVVERALSARPQPRPSADVVAAVLARAAEPAADALAAESPVEAAVLAQSLQALDRLPMARPGAAVIEAVEARAAQASAGLDAVRAVYQDAPAVVSVEAEVLRQSRAAVEQTMTSQPRLRPSADVTAAVLARAAEASGLDAETVADGSTVEAALLDQSFRALDRLPRSRPSAATLDAVRVAAATAGVSPVRDDRPAASPDRAPARPSRRRTPVGVWAGATTFLVAALAAIVVLPLGESSEVSASLADVAEAEPAGAAAPAAAPLAALEPDPAPADPEPTFAPSPPSTTAAMSGLAAAVQRVARPSPPARTAPAEPTQAALASATPAPAASTPGWEASDDVRALSLRLQELDGEDALAWDEAPAETFGVPTSRSVGSAPGIQAVRAGAPARARFRSDSSSVQR